MGTVNENIKISMVDAFSQGLVKLNSGIEGNQKRMEQFAGAAKTAAAGLTAFAGTQAALNLLDSAKNWGNAIDEIQDKTGLSGKAASELLVISNTVGLANDEMGQAIMKMSKSAATAREALLSARDAGKESNDTFSKWGITILDDNDNLLDADQIMRNVTQRHREMADGTAKNAMEMEIFGRSGGKMKDMLDLTDERIAEFIKHAQKAGLIVGDDFAPKMEKLQQDTNLLNLEFEGLKMQLGMQLMPEFINMEKKAQDMIDTYGQLDDGTKDLIADSIKFGIEFAAVGTAINAVIWLADPFVSFANVIIGALDKIAKQAGLTRMALLGPIGIGAAIIGGTNAYLMSQELPGYDQTRETFENYGLDPDKYMGDRPTNSTADFRKLNESIKAPVDKKPDYATNTSKYSGGSTHVSDASAANAAAKKAETEYDRMVGRYQKLVSEMDMRITDEVGTDAEKVTKKAEQEIASLQEDINRIRAQGIDTTKLDELIKRYKEEIVPQKVAEADRDEKVQKYKDLLESSALQVDIEGKTNDEINVLRMEQLSDYENYLRMQLESTKLSVADRLKLERDLADAIQQQHEITAQNIVGGWNQAFEQLKNYSFDYEEHFTSMFDSIGDSLANTFDGMVDDNKSITDSIVDSWEDVGNTIQKAIYKAAMEILVVKPLFSWLGNVLGNIGGGSSDINAAAASPKPFADGGQALGWSIVGEHGKELVNFTNPARVYSANQTQAMLAPGNSAPNVNVNVHNNGNQNMKADTDVKWNGKEYVVNILLETITTNYGGVRDVIKAV